MAVHLHHVNILAEDLEATVAFYVEAVGLTKGERPAFGFPGAWLYDGARPAVHLTLAAEPPAGAAAASITSPSPMTRSTRRWPGSTG